jgi:hypothetical protein
MVLDGIRDLSGALRGCAKLLRTGGTLVATVSHPCFTFDLLQFSDGALPYQLEVESTWKFPGLSPEVPYFRRSLATYVNAVSAAGLRLVDLIEPAPSAEYLRFIDTRSFDEEDRRRRNPSQMRPSFVLGIRARQD